MVPRGGEGRRSACAYGEKPQCFAGAGGGHNHPKAAVGILQSEAVRAGGECQKWTRLCEECCAKDYEEVQGFKQNARLSSSQRPIVSPVLVRASRCSL